MTQRLKQCYNIWKWIIIPLLGNGCASNNLFKPERVASPVIQDMYDTPVKESVSSEKFHENMLYVPPETRPGQNISMKPDPAIHAAVKPKNSEVMDNHGTGESQPQITAQPEKPAKKAKSPVTYTGKELLRTKQMMTRSAIMDLITIIRGNAIVRHEEMTMRSHELKVEGEKGDFVKSDFPVVINDYKSNTILKAGYGEYTASEDRAYFNKKPVVVHADIKTKVKTTLVADEMDRFFNDSITRAYGHVIVYYPEATAYGSFGTYYEAEEKIVLVGNPRVYEKKNVYMADKMTVYREKKIAILEGNVRVFLTQQKEGAAQNDSQEVLTILTGDYGEYRYGDEVKVTEMQTRRKDSFVYISRKDSDTYCRRLIARGEGLQEMELFENIYILDLENRTRLYGEYATYSKMEQRAKVYTRANAAGEIIHPLMFFYSKKDIINARMMSELIDRDIEKKMTYGRGNVVFLLYEKSDNPDSLPHLQNTAIGEWSEMADQEKIIYIMGHPYLKNEDNKIYASQIAMYPDENRLELLKSLEGVFSR